MRGSKSPAALAQDAVGIGTPSLHGNNCGRRGVVGEPDVAYDALSTLASVEKVSDSWKDESTVSGSATSQPSANL